MLTVAIYGGAFNPPTVTGHRHVVRELLGYNSGIDAIAVVPAFRHVFKPELEQTFETRLHMCRHTFTGLNVIISDAERRAIVQDSCDGSTIQLIEFIKKEHPNINFRVIVGVDNADTIDLWKEPSKLIAMVPFTVVARGGYTPQSDWYKKRPHRYVNIPMQEISSSAIREAVVRGDWDFLKTHIHADVIEMIKRENLYV